MQPKTRADLTSRNASSGALREANFYALPFAAQMIVWALRRRLAALHGRGPDDDDVLHVFHMAGWGELYTHLLAVADTLLAAWPRGGLPLHAVSCPCLAPHEAHLLNALAHVQSGRDEEGLLCLCEIMAPAGVRLAMPPVRAIAAELRAQNLRFVYVDTSTAAVPTRAAPVKGAMNYVH